MPLIVISGLPCSGKSKAAAVLAEVCRLRGQDVQIVDEDSLHLQRNESYKGATAGAAAGVAATHRLSPTDALLPAPTSGLHLSGRRRNKRKGGTGHADGCR